MTGALHCIDCGKRGYSAAPLEQLTDPSCESCGGRLQCAPTRPLVLHEDPLATAARAARDTQRP